MELIVLYGAPGVGKLTVARELALKSGYRLFHNHLTVDLVTSLFDFGTERADRLTAKFRLELLGEAARAGIAGVIYTLVYARGEDDQFVQDVIDAVEPHGGDVRFVLLTCEKDELLRRVTAESRSRFGKLRDREMVERMLGQMELSAPVPHRPGLTIDNTHLPAPDAADRILDYMRQHHR